jgi:type I restriction enzyme R subunit
VLAHYVDAGITELAPTKLKTFIDLKYQGIRDMPEALGKAADVKKLFVEFQQRLYEPF